MNIKPSQSAKDEAADIVGDWPDGMRATDYFEQAIATALAAKDAEMGAIEQMQASATQGLRDEVQRLTEAHDRMKWAAEVADNEKAARMDAEKERDTLRASLINLLCRIHRDGGHYLHAHGLEKACADADTIVAQLNADRDCEPMAEIAALRSGVERLRVLLDLRGGCPPDKGEGYADWFAWAVQEVEKDLKVKHLRTQLDEAVEALMECESWMRCECGHPACKRCKATKEAAAIVARREKNASNQPVKTS